MPRPTQLTACASRAALFVLTLAACEGPAGPRGTDGKDGKDGVQGPEGPAGEAGAPGRDADGGTSAPDGGDAGVDFPLEPDGLVGVLTDTAGRVVSGGRVRLVPVESVRALPAMDLSLTPEAAATFVGDEPLEDLVDSQGDTLASAPVDDAGRYRFASLPEGAFFLVFTPAEDDAEHLPSSERSRLPRSAETVRGTRVDLRVSCTPSPAAYYVGTSSCLTCHGRHSQLESAHAITVRRPGLNSYYQDVSRAPRIDEALTAFRAGRTLTFYDCAARDDDQPACSVSETAPAEPERVGFTIRLRYDATLAADELGKYAVEVVSRDGSNSQTLPLLLTVGGALSYQQFVVRAPLEDGAFTHFVLPLSYQLAGSDDRSSPRDFRWAAYRAEDWTDFASGAVHTPPRAQAFDRQCAGCHATGLELTGDAEHGFVASAAPERDGVVDLDGDGRLEQLFVSCEACHGPGSEHLERAPRGQAIVNPGLLTPERQALVCGACHSNPRGKDGSLAPLDAAGHMPRPGERRATYIADHLSRVDASEDDLFASGDSRHAHQQYTDFVRSKKYRSANLLATCTDCHTPHREVDQPASLRSAPSDDTACAACHAQPSDIHAHALTKARFDHVRAVDQDALSCVACHMVKTAAGGARPLGIVDQSPATPVVEYVMGDRTSHRFGYVGRSAATAQPIAATQACTFCHVDFLPNQ